MTADDSKRISAIRRAAAKARWAGCERAVYRTIRIREDVLARLKRSPGETWSVKISRLLQASS